MGIMKQFSAVMLLSATPANADAIIRDLPPILENCAVDAVKANSPKDAAYEGYEAENIIGGAKIITHEFLAEAKYLAVKGPPLGKLWLYDDVQKSVKIVIYPEKTDLGSMHITSYEKRGASKALAVITMDKNAVSQEDYTMSIDPKGPKSDVLSESAAKRAASTLASLVACMTRQP